MDGKHHLSFFGIPELRNPAGHLVRLRTRKQLGLLVYLAVDGRSHPVSRETLVELLWPGVPQKKARHSLSQALTAIRTEFGEGAIRKVGESIVFVGALATDLDAVDLNGADIARPLYETDNCAGAEFAHWVDGARERCAEAARKALGKAIEHARLAGDTTAVHERAARLYAVDPFSDVAAQALTEQMVLQGDMSR